MADCATNTLVLGNAREETTVVSHMQSRPAQSTEIVAYKPSVNFNTVEMDSDGSDDIDPDCY